MNFNNISKFKLLSLLLIFQLSFTLILTNLIIQNYINLHTQVNIKNNEINYEIADNLHGNSELEQKVISDKSYFSKLKNFHSDLINNSKFNYYEYIDQQLYLKNFNGEEKFYNEFKYSKNIHENGDVVINGEKLSGIKNKIVSESILDKYNIKVCEGRMFTSEDFLLKNFNQVIPILLGNDFKNNYSVGDTIDGELNYFKFKFKVVGILEKNTLLNPLDSNNLESLDTYIITPSFNVSDNIKFNSTEEVMFTNFFYLQKTNGIVGLSENFPLSEFISDLEYLVKKNDIFDYQLNNILKLNTSFIKLSSNDSINIIKLIGIFMSVLSIIIVVFTSLQKLLHNKYNNLSICPWFKKGLINVFIQLFLLCLFSNLLAHILTNLLSGKHLEYSLMNFIISLFIITIGLIISFKIYNKKLIK